MLNQDNLAEFKGQIVDVFEDFCDDKQISITNPEKDAYDKECGYEEGENCAILFGDDYSAIADEFEQAVYDYSLFDNEFPNFDSMSNTIENSINAFTGILAERGSRQITTGESVYLAGKLVVMLKHWNLWR